MTFKGSPQAQSSVQSVYEADKKHTVCHSCGKHCTHCHSWMEDDYWSNKGIKYDQSWVHGIFEIKNDHKITLGLINNKLRDASETFEAIFTKESGWDQFCLWFGAGGWLVFVGIFAFFGYICRHNLKDKARNSEAEGFNQNQVKESHKIQLL